ncbi:MAG: hypothetical protein ABJL37_12135 [Ekhidna sp.]
MVPLFFQGCNSDDPDPGQITFGLLEPKVTDRTYSSITFNIGLRFSDAEVEEVFVAISEDQDLDINEFYDRTLRFKDFSFSKLPFTGNQVDFKSTDLTPETGYTFIFYHTSGNDTLVETRSESTAFLEPFGFEPRIVGSGGKVNLINLKVDEDDLSRLSFYAGERELEIISSEQSPNLVNSERSFIIQVPEFDSYDSLKLTAKFDDNELEGQYVEYGSNGTGIQPFYQEKLKYIIPSDWSYKSMLIQELSDNRRAFFKNEIYVELNGEIYFYGHGSVGDETFGLYSFDFENLDHERVISHDFSESFLNQTLVEEEGQLIRYHVEEDSIVKEKINLDSKSYELLDDDVLDQIEVGKGFFHEGDFYHYTFSGAKKYNLVSGEETGLNMLDDYSSVLAPRRDIYQTKSYVISKDFDDTFNFWDLRIYDISNDTWTSTQFPNEAVSNFTIFEHEGLIGAGHVKKELYFFFPGSNEWKYLNEFQVSHHARNDFIQTVPFYIPSSQKTIFLAGEGIYEFNPIGVDLID